MQAVDARDEARSVQAINRSRESLVAVGFAPPTWELLVSETAHPPRVADGDQPRVGRQARAVRGGVVLFERPEVDFVKRRRRDAQVLRWATGLTSHQLPDESHFSSGTTTSPGLVPLSLATPSPSLSPCLLMWPSSRRSLAIIGRPVLLLGRRVAEGSISRMW